MKVTPASPWSFGEVGHPSTPKVWHAFTTSIHSFPGKERKNIACRWSLMTVAQILSHCSCRNLGGPFAPSSKGLIQYRRKGAARALPAVGEECTCRRGLQQGCHQACRAPVLRDVPALSSLWSDTCLNTEVVSWAELSEKEKSRSCLGF